MKNNQNDNQEQRNPENQNQGSQQNQSNQNTVQNSSATQRNAAENDEMYQTEKERKTKSTFDQINNNTDEGSDRNENSMSKQMTDQEESGVSTEQIDGKSQAEKGSNMKSTFDQINNNKNEVNPNKGSSQERSSDNNQNR